MPDFIKPDQITVGDFVLKPISATIKNAQLIFDIFSKDSESMLFWMPNGVFESPEQVLVSYFQRTKSMRVFLYGIFKNDNLLGEIGFVGIDMNAGKLEIGYWLKKSARGKGIINKLLPKIEEIAFGQDWCHKIALHCDVENIPSTKIAEQNGYILEGTIRQDTKWPDGSLRDKLYFGKLKSELQS